MVKFTTEIVTGDCPECTTKTMLVNIDNNVFRCVNCENSQKKTWPHKKKMGT